MDQNLVKKLVNEAISDNESLFLIELSFLVGNRIKVVVDGDQGISIKECMRISRHVEHSFDREEEDFGLEVTSPDISHPLTVRRQYLKNINRVLKVKTEEEELEGTLISINEKEISLRWKTREPKPIGKGKVTVEKNASIAFNSIKEAKVKITY
ncbi:MAG: ribosome assembly cofactor RimP [Flavobacteriaceae bacterium]|jgi:ribosome maturation factor RimP|tara:strand:+ start:503 stop:964 length:462 start_codon:yes stop_codon:yes gene_type:complete